MRVELLVLLVVLLSGCVGRPPETPTTLEVASTTIAVTSMMEVLTTTSTTSASSTTTILTISDAIEDNCIGFLVGAPEDMGTIAVVGAGWARPHPGPFAWGWIEKTRGEYDFSAVDEYVRRAQENNVAILATVWPYADWDHEECHSVECDVSEGDIFYPRKKFSSVEGIPRKRCIPCDLDAYKVFVSKLVDRYDGDGVDDMPGLTLPIIYYEILNEPSMQEEDLTFFRGTPAEYVEIIRASYEAVKGTCPECRVVQAGASGIHDEPIRFWDDAFALGAGDYFDVANIHFIGSGDLSTLNVGDFKKLMGKHSIDKPVWVTEAEFRGIGEVDGAVTGALNAGAERIFFTGFGAGHEPLQKPGQFAQLYKTQRDKC
ncbi:MAG: hypothetical protein V1921_06120 [Candidatus Altiarchaeota archaeon]